MMVIMKRKKKIKRGPICMEGIFGKESCLSSAAKTSLFS